MGHFNQPKLLAQTGFFACFQGYWTILLFGFVHKVPRVRALHYMSVGVDNGILILAVHGSPVFVSISPTLVDRSWSCQSAQALRVASVLFAGSAGNQPSRHGLAFAFEVKLAPPRVMNRIFKPPFSMTGGDIAGTGEVSIRFLLSAFVFCFLKNPLLYRSGSAGEHSGGAQKFP